MGAFFSSMERVLSDIHSLRDLILSLIREHVLNCVEPI